MIMKSLFCLAAFVGSLFGTPASAATTSKNVDIIVTHGAALMTFTFVNSTGNTLPAGTPVSLGQAFRYGDIMPGHYPLLRDAKTHVPLAAQQWDEISTWQNGNGSWRHGVWAAQLPTSLASGATYTVEFVPTPGTYTATSHQPLTALCSGPGVHDLKVHLAGVRNQDDSVRDSGDATFRVCDNIANTGRDAPLHTRAGSVYDEYVVSGMFTYASSGHKDPLLYAQCIVDLFTDVADGTSLKDVRHVCTVHNSWMNVAAGSAGNAGNLGPAGFANDPQTIAYRPEILDGSTSALNWSGLDATLNSATSPVQTSGCGDTYNGTICLNVPTSVGPNAWYDGMAVRVSTTGTAVGGLTPGKLYWVYNSGTVGSRSSANSNFVQLIPNPGIAFGGQGVLTSSQGSGTTSLSLVVFHPYREAWQLLDASADENWTTRGSTARFTRPIFPAFTASEQRYWEETGLMMPVNLAQVPAIPVSYSQGDDANYHPFSKGNVIGGSGTGDRADLGWIPEYATAAFITEKPSDWALARLFTMGTTTHGDSTMLNEATGRIPPLNNGPPTGPNGNGVGGSYPALGAPQPAVSWVFGGQGVAHAPSNIPNTVVDWRCGAWTNACGTGLDHMPAFDGLTYMVFGSRHFLDMMRQNGNRALLKVEPGVGPGFRDDIQGGVHYYGLILNCCEIRGTAWGNRDRIFPAAFGADGDPEKQYFADQITEEGNYYPHYVNFQNGPGSTAFDSGILLPDSGITAIDTFITNYLFLATYGMKTFLHASLADQWLPPMQRFYEGVCGGQMAGAPPVAYCIDYSYSPVIHDGDHPLAGGNIGQYLNGTDASDFGSFAPYTFVLSGGKLHQQLTGIGYYTLAVGDKVKVINGAFWGNANQLIRQMPGNTWMTVVGPIDNTAGTYFVQCPPGHAVDATCPTPGAAFTGFTYANGAAIPSTDLQAIIYRPSFDPGNGYVDWNYVNYGAQTMHGLKILGYDVSHALSNLAARNENSYYDPTSHPSRWWDDIIVVPR